MSTVVTSGPQQQTLARPAGFKRALLTSCVMCAAILQTLDSTIANVALPYMQGSLSASLDQVRDAATKLAAEIAEAAPLAIISTRKTMRGTLADRVKAATDHELKEQTWLRGTEDFKEGVKATNERRVANWKGR